MTQLIEITDPADPRLENFRSLRDVQLRQHLEIAGGIFIAEGEKVINRAAAAGLQAHSFLLSPRWVSGLSSVLANSGATGYLVTDALAEQVTGFHVHRGALAAFYRPPPADYAKLLRTSETVLVLEDIVDHTNVGAIFRNAAGLGVDAVLLTSRCADPLYRRSIKVSMGAVFNLPWARIPSWQQHLSDLRQAGFTSVAMTLRPESLPIAEVFDGIGKLAILLGSEGPGLTEEWQKAADLGARIAMRNGIDSLNVAATSALVCYLAELRNRPS